MQRRFGWGDVQATKEEVVAAACEGNSAELLAIMSEAAPLVHRGELQHLPALFGALRSGLPAALADCKHQFLTESMFTPRVLGPCGCIQARLHQMPHMRRCSVQALRRELPQPHHPPARPQHPAPAGVLPRQPMRTLRTLPSHEPTEERNPATPPGPC